VRSLLRAGSAGIELSTFCYRFSRVQDSRQPAPCSWSKSIFWNAGFCFEWRGDEACSSAPDCLFLGWLLWWRRVFGKHIALARSNRIDVGGTRELDPRNYMGFVANIVGRYVDGCSSQLHYNAVWRHHEAWELDEVTACVSACSYRVGGPSGSAAPAEDQRSTLVSRQALCCGFRQSICSDYQEKSQRLQQRKTSEHGQAKRILNLAA